MKKILPLMIVFSTLLLNHLLLSPCSGAKVGNYLHMFEDKVSEFTLDNGLKFLVIEIHQVPIASFVTFVDAGGVNEKTGLTGIAHMFEHMAFKGTRNIGTKNWEKEKELLDELDLAYREWRQARSRGDAKQVERKRNKFKKLQKKAKNLTKPNEFSKILEKNGANNLNAGTSTDATFYYTSLPANRAELWFNLESRRLRRPVFREFYTEKKVILEERYMRVQSNPTGKLIERLQSIAYLAHPYGQPVIGWTSDIKSLRKSQLKDFYRKYYLPENITIAVAGDITPQQVKKWAKLYFASWKKASEPPQVKVKEPEQEGKRCFQINAAHEPVYVRAYRTVSQEHPDFLDLELLATILAQGRTSRLYSSLVQEKMLASKITAFNGYPGTKFPSLFIVYAVPNELVELSMLSEEIDSQLQKVKKGKITSQELQRAKTKSRADLVRTLDSNMGLAKSLVRAEGQRGDWKKVFTDLEKLQNITLKDLQEVAKKYLQEKKSVVGKLVDNRKE